MKGTIAGDDVTDYLDQRDNIVSKMSQEVGVSMSLRANGDAALYTDSGVVLFDKTARTVSFAADQRLYAPAPPGNAVYIDGVPVTGANSVMPIKTGKLAGLAQLRDNATVTYQSQLDEVARGLVERLQGESTSPAPRCPTARPLHLSRRARDARKRDRLGGPGRHDHALPRRSTRPRAAIPTCCATARSAATSPTDTTPPAMAGYSARLQQLIGNMDASQPFDATTQGKPSGSLIDFAASSTSWIENQRKTADDSATYQNTLLDRSTAALSNVSGVNMDDEMSLMLQVERTYSASSKIISTVDEMLQSLLAAVGN